MKIQIYTLIILFGICYSDEPPALRHDGTCKAYLEDGRVIDLSPLDNSTAPM